MYRLVILILFILVLSIDFMREVTKIKNQSIIDMFIRGFMIIAFCFICEWF